MDENTMAVIIAGLITGCITVGVIAQAWVGRRDRKSLPEATLGRVEERLARMEQAIDSIAIEMERVSEGQRFTTKLLTDRPRESEEQSARGA